MKKAWPAVLVATAFAVAFPACGEETEKNLRDAASDAEREGKKAAKDVEREGRKAADDLEREADKVGDGK